MGSGMWGIGFAVVTARTRKLLKRFAATPMRRRHYLLVLRPLAAALPGPRGGGGGRLRLAASSASRCAGRSSPCALVSLLGALTFAGLGLLVAARPRTIEAVSGLDEPGQLPMWLLSGSFFSYERFPEAVLAGDPRCCR